MTSTSASPAGLDPKNQSTGDNTTQGLVRLLAALATLVFGTVALWWELPVAVRFLLFAIAAAAIVVAGRTVLRDGAPGAASFFAPLGFPVAYTALAFLAPVWMLEARGIRVGALARDYAIASETASILGIGLLAFCLGALFFPRVLRDDHANNNLNFVRVLRHARALMLLSLVWLAFSVTTGAITDRGRGQLERDVSDSLVVLQTAAAVAGVVLLLGARHALRRAPLGAIDALLLVSTLVGLGLRGSRGDALALVLAFLVLYTRRGGGWKIVAVSLVTALLFSYAVLAYRSQAPQEKEPIESFVGDLASISFTTGATASAVPERVDYKLGSTVLASVKRQLPGPISNRFFGPPDDTGAREFRKIISFTSPNQGFGYSVPAEGYLNFGLAGTALFCGIYGLVLAGAHARSYRPPSRLGYYTYAVLVANLPFALRSDLLGVIKSNLYPLLLVWLVLTLARQRTGPRDAPRSGTRPTLLAGRSTKPTSSPR